MDEDKVASGGWRFEEQDEAKFNFGDEKGAWQPKPEDIFMILEKLDQAKGGPLPIKWTCPGRRAPEKQDKQDNGAADKTKKDGDVSKEEDLRAPEVSAFDFDEFQMDVGAKLTPRAVPGGRTPRTEKKVAKMEDIMNSLRKQQLQRAAERDAKKKSSMGTSRLLNFKTADFKSGASKISPFSPVRKVEMPKTPVSEAGKPSTSIANGSEVVSKSSASKSLFADSSLNSSVSDLSLDSKTSIPEADAEKQNAESNSPAVLPIVEGLTVSAESTPPPGDIQPVVTNLNDLMEPNSITVIAKPSLDSEFTQPTVLNLEPIPALDKAPAPKDVTSQSDIKQPEPSSSAAASPHAEQAATSSAPVAPETTASTAVSSTDAPDTETAASVTAQDQANNSTGGDSEPKNEGST